MGKSTSKKSKYFLCGRCFNPPKLTNKTARVNINGVKMCQSCFEKETPTNDCQEELKWYVIQVEPGKDGSVKKEILRRVRIENLESEVKRVLTPTKFQDIIAPKGGDTLGDGSGIVTANEARKIANEFAIKKAEDNQVYQEDPDKPTHPYKVTVWEEEKTGKWSWRVRIMNEPTQRTIRVLKYPGYVIINMRWGGATENLITKIRGVWGFLIRPVAPDYKIKVNNKPTQKGFRWKLFSINNKETIEFGHEPTELKARQEAEKALSKAIEFVPTPMDTQEAAETLIQEKAVNQIVKDKEEYQKVNLSYKVGDKRVLTNGPYKGVEVVIESVDRSDKTNPKITVGFELFGVKLSIPLLHHHWV